MATNYHGNVSGQANLVLQGVSLAPTYQVTVSGQISANVTFSNNNTFFTAQETFIGDANFHVTNDPTAGGYHDFSENETYTTGTLSGPVSNIIGQLINTGDTTASFLGSFTPDLSQIVGNASVAFQDFSGSVPLAVDLIPGLPTSMISIDSYTGSIGERHGPITVTLSRSFDTSQTATVQVDVVGGTAVQNVNYKLVTPTSTPAIVAFAPGDTTKTITIAPVDDFTIDPGLDLEVKLSNPTNATLGASTADVEITDEDQPPNFPALPQGTLVLTGAAGTIIPVPNPGQGQVLVVAAGSVVHATISNTSGNHVTYAAPLVGGVGNKFIAGSGVDRYMGGSGNNTYVAGSGTTIVDYSLAPKAVTINLQSGIAANGFGGTDTLTNIHDVAGSGFNDTIIGSTGNDVIQGGGGADVLTGGSGADQFLFGSPSDGGDTITDFSSLLGDSFALDHTGFGLSTPGTLAASGVAFMLGAKAQTAQPTIIDNAGDLYWDGDGIGAAAPTLLAHVAMTTTVSDPSTQGWSLVASGDFNNDGTADLLWKAAGTGATSEWLMQNGQLVANPASPNANGWNVVATGDFNKDGISDILWKTNGSGDTSLWLMGPNGLAGNPSTPNANGWNVAATGDFNHDGVTDILWKTNGSGDTSLWLMGPNGLAGNPSTPNAAGWNVVATGDFNNDGISDILWKEDGVGATSLWLMGPNGMVANPSTPNANGWNVAATGDFNHDGITDILWKEDGVGATSLWLMGPNGMVANPSTPNANGWNVAATGDFNHDGITDILWKAGATGATSEWVMGPNGLASNPATPNANGWSVDAAADLNGDGTTDILWQAGNATSAWLMSGTGLSGNPVTPTTGGGSFITTADLDGNGIQDVLFANPAAATTTSWLFNHVSGNNWAAT